MIRPHELKINYHYETLDHPQYTYVLLRDFTFTHHELLANLDVKHKYIRINKGKLTLKKGYAWDGVSGWKDLPSLMRAALIHDAFYQLLRERLLPTSMRSLADLIFRQIAAADGTSKFLRWVLYLVLRMVGWRYSTPNPMEA